MGGSIDEARRRYAEELRFTAKLGSRPVIDAFAAVVCAKGLRRIGGRDIERRQFELHYQPKVNIKTRRIDGTNSSKRERVC